MGRGVFSFKIEPGIFGLLRLGDEDGRRDEKKNEKKNGLAQNHSP